MIAEIGAASRGEVGLEGGGLGGVGEAPAALVDHLGDGAQAGMVVIAQAPLLVVKHAVEEGHFGGDGEELVDLLLILHRRMRHLRMGEHIGHLVRDAVGIDGNRDRAEPLRRRHGPVEPRPVVADDGDLAAALQAERLQARRIGAHGVVHLGPGLGLPDAEVLVPERRPRGADAGVPYDQLRKCVVARGCRRRHRPSLPGAAAASKAAAERSNPLAAGASRRLEPSPRPVGGSLDRGRQRDKSSKACGNANIQESEAGRLRASLPSGRDGGLDGLLDSVNDRAEPRPAPGTVPCPCRPTIRSPP